MSTGQQATVDRLAAQYPTVASPFEIDSLRLKNRIFVSAHTTNFGEDFLPTERHIRYHVERARGGVALIIVEPLRVHATSLGRPGGLAGFDPRARATLSRLTQEVKAHGTAIFVQLTHAGRHSDNVFLRTPSWGPSPIRWALKGATPHAISRPEMREVRDGYIASARLAQSTGFDGLEIHFGHGHLLHQFISPLANSRDDAYGGSETNRLRFPFEVLEAVVDAVGDSLLVGVRLSGDELAPGGQDLEFGQRIAGRLAETPGVSFLNVSHSSYTVPSIGYHVADMAYGDAPFMHIPLAIRQAAPAIPMLAACRYTSLAVAETALRADAADMIAMTRAHIADPHVIAKAQSGRDAEIRPCVSCNFCIGEIGAHRGLSCMMNPAAGREAEWPEDSPPAAARKRVLVVGAGPAGLEAARVAAERGHDVTVWEEADEAGGQLRLARRGHRREELDQLVSYELHQLERLAVPVLTQQPATPQSIDEFAPDALVIATGSRPHADAKQEAGPKRLTVHDALQRQDWSGEHVLVVDGVGDWSSASVIETVAARGGQVTVAVSADTFLWAINDYTRMTIIARLEELPVEVQLWTNGVTIGPDGVELHTRLSLRFISVPDVTAMVECGVRKASDDLAGDALTAAPEIHLVGDAQAPRSLFEAMYEGHRIGRRL